MIVGNRLLHMFSPHPEKFLVPPLAIAEFATRVRSHKNDSGTARQSGTALTLLASSRFACGHINTKFSRFSTLAQTCRAATATTRSDTAQQLLVLYLAAMPPGC